MPCVAPPAFPALPDIFPFTLTPPTLPPLDLSVDFCCRFSLIVVPPIIPLGPLVLAIPGASAVILAINESLTAIELYLAALPLDCPLS